MDRGGRSRAGDAPAALQITGFIEQAEAAIGRSITQGSDALAVSQRPPLSRQMPRSLRQSSPSRERALRILP